jgi:hypothetical protein
MRWCRTVASVEDTINAAAVEARQRLRRGARRRTVFAMALARVALLAVLAAAQAPGAQAPSPPSPRPAGLPLLDLSAHASRQVVVDREAGH